MRYYVEQKLFSFKDKFNVYDETGNSVYYIESKFFTLGKQFHVYDQYQQQVAFISQRVWTFLPKFDIYVDDELIGTIIKEFTFFTPSYYLENSSLTVEGDFFSHEYSIYDNGRPIAEISKQWWTFGDKYGIEIDDNYNPIIAISIMLAIDAVMASQDAAAASASNG